MSNFWAEILEVAGDEAIEAVVIGDADWGRDDSNRAVPADRKFIVITPDEAAQLLTYEHDDGFGWPDCHAVYAWTATRVLFVSEYDGSTTIDDMPRNPGPCTPRMS